MTTILNVANRLPVTVGQTVTKSSGGLVAALEGVAEEGYALRWIGWPGTDTPDPARQKEVRRLLTEACDCVPVFLSPEQVEAFYEGFANSSLWPLLHYMPSRFRYEPAWWDHYQTVNQRFADTVLGIAKEGDFVWVHDYHLMLLPAMLREAMPSLRIGFFLHTPFPSYEVFRCHPRRNELLEGLLGADQVGFHTFGYVRHFRSAVLRLLGIESEMMRIRHGGQTTFLGVYPIGINAPKFQAELNSAEFARQFAQATEAHAGKQVVLSVERLDYTKGLLERLDAIDLFLAQRADGQNVKFIFISVPSRENVDEYQTLREEVEGRIGRLNGRYATLVDSPIRFIHGSVSFTELCALYSIADVGLVTPLMDGMNLVAKEYVACQREHPGALVLSEFAGAAEELFSAIIVNPYDAQAVAGAIQQALSLTPQEKQARMRPMRDRVLRCDANAWARSFVQALASRPPADLPKQHLAQAKDGLVRALRNGGKVAFFLDYDGTLREIVSEPSAAAVTPALQRLLERLASMAQVQPELAGRGGQPAASPAAARTARAAPTAAGTGPHLDVTIISGRTPEDLERWLGGYPFALVAEHGAAIRRAGQTQWEQLDRNISYAWKDELRKVLELWADSTPGSFVEDKRTSLVWHYRRADPEFGQWKAKQLADELAVLTTNQPLQVRHGKKIIEVTSSQVNKGAAILHLLEQSAYDRVLVAGDDQTDETMYRLQVPNLLSVHVGRADTAAQFQTPTPAALRQFLEEVLNAIC